MPRSLADFHGVEEPGGGGFPGRASHWTRLPWGPEPPSKVPTASLAFLRRRVISCAADS